jgi:cell division protein FtsA
MEQTDQIIGAIDIGTTKIVTIIGKINTSGKLEILALAKADSKGVKRGVVQNIEETVTSIRKTVEEAELKAGVKLSEVFVGIAGQHIKSMKIGSHIHRDNSDEEITREDLKQLEEDVRKIPLNNGESIIHVIPQSYVVDNESGFRNPVGMPGKRIEGNFHLVIANMDSQKILEKCVNRVGLKVKCLMLEPIASAEAVLTDDEKEAGVALVDIGGGTTDIAIYHDFVIAHTAVIPFGGNIVTEDIKKGCAILQKQAELLKIQYGSAFGELADPDKVVSISGIAGRDAREISFRNLAYIIQFRMEEIIDKVYYEIERSGVADSLSAGFVFTGGGALLKHLPQFVKFHTGMDVRIGFPGEHLAASTPAEYNHPIYATAIGLLLKGYEYLKENNENLETNSLTKEQTPENTEANEQMADTSTKETKKKGGFLDAVRKTFSELFEEDDTKM